MSKESLASKPWLNKHGKKIIALVFWLVLLVAYQYYANENGLTYFQVMQRFVNFMAQTAWGPAIYFVLYAIRPLILFPASVLSMAGGFLFGPIPGVLYTILASNVSSSVVFYIGYFFGQDVIHHESSKNIVTRYAGRLRQHSFETALIMRFVFIPYDLVSILSGFLQIRWVPFILATMLGSIPGTITFVLAGASLEFFEGNLPKMNPTTLLISFGAFLVSLGLSRLFKKQEEVKA
jgi:uncharacterized membrane protein YdjX (TVP38/TMEM64 family)